MSSSRVEKIKKSPLKINAAGVQLVYHLEKGTARMEKKSYNNTNSPRLISRMLITEMCEEDGRAATSMMNRTFRLERSRNP